MNTKSQLARVAAVSLVLLFLFVILLYPHRPTATSLAYPPPENNGYPGQGTESGYAATASPTATPAAFDSYDAKPPTAVWEVTAVAGNPTPWNPPTPHPFATAVGPRQGMGGSWHATVAISNRFRLGNWVLDWGSIVPSPTATPGTPTPGSPLEYVPMITWGAYYDFNLTKAQVVEHDGYTTHDYWLVFNECEHYGQCDASPSEAADFFHNEVLRHLYELGGDPNAQLIIGGVNANPCGLMWLDEFIRVYRQRYGEIPRAGWHFHLYPEVIPQNWNPDGTTDCGGDWVWNLDAFTEPLPTATGPAGAGTPVPSLWPLWYDQARSILYHLLWNHGRESDEVWITEMGCLFANWQPAVTPAPTAVPGCQTEGFMYPYTSRILEWLNNEGRWVDRYAWYTDWDTKNWQQTHLFNMTVTPTPSATPTGALTPTPAGTPTPIPTPFLSNAGSFYGQVTPAGVATKIWPVSRAYLPYASKS